MKLFNLIWVLAVVGAAAACNSGDPVEGCDPGERVNLDGRCEPIGGGGSGGSGGSAGTGGTGGVAPGACTDEADEAVYADLEYTNADAPPETTMGSAAASAIASDCVFGSANSVPSLAGCNDEAGVILGCAITASCTPAQVDALSACVEACMQDAIMEVTGSMLTAECGACYSASVACSAEKCATSGCSNPTSSRCIECRCENDCTPGFDRCSGLPSSGDCD